MSYIGRKGARAALIPEDIPADLILKGSRVTIPTIATDNARDIAITSPANGMLTYNTAAGALQQYNGVWSTIAPAPNITSVSGLLNDDTDSTLTIHGTNFTTSSAVKMFDASSGGSQIGSDATTTFNSDTKLTAVFGAGSIGASGSTAYIEVDNAGAANRFTTAITVNADPTVTHAGATGTNADTTDHLGTYGGSTTGGGDDSNTIFLLNFDRVDGSTDFEDSSNIGGYGNKVVAGANAHIETDQYKFGTSSGHFDGTGDYLKVGVKTDSPANMGFSTSDDFTMDCWIRTSSAQSNTTGRLFGTTNEAAWTSNAWWWGYYDSYIYTQHSTDIYSTSKRLSVGNLHDSAWHHIAIVRPAAANTTMKVYVDGNYKGELTGLGNSLGDNSWAVGIAAGEPGGSGYWWNGYLDSFRISRSLRYTTTVESDWGNFSEPTSLYGAFLSKTIPTITLTGTATQLAADEDIEFTAVENSGKADGSRSFIDTDIGLTLTNLTGDDKNKATLTGTITSAGGTTHTNMPLKLQVRKTLANAAYANASRVVTFSGGTVTTGLAPAMPVSGTGIPAATTITSVDTSTTITLSADPTGGTLTGQSLVFSDLTRVSHQYNGSDTINNADAMYTLATATGGAPVLFNARRYMGTGTLHARTGLGFQPDLIWIKNRERASYEHCVFDSVRGVSISAAKVLFTNSNGAEQSTANMLTEFNSDGFGLGIDTAAAYVNYRVEGHIAWGWKAGGAPSGELVGTGATMSGTSGAGTIHNSATGVSNLTSLTQSVNQTSGFSITKFTGHTSGGTFPHNLGGTPAFIMIKNLEASAENWTVWHKNLTATSDYHMVLNTDVAEQGNSTIYPTAPSSTLIYTGTDGNNGGTAVTSICYAWKAVAGVSAFGVNTGQLSNVSGTTVGVTGYCGFLPKFIIIKNIDTGNPWLLFDTFRSGTTIYNDYIKADESSAEATVTNVEVTPKPTGFTTGSHSAVGSGSDKYIWAAFA